MQTGQSQGQREDSGSKRRGSTGSSTDRHVMIGHLGPGEIKARRPCEKSVSRVRIRLAAIGRINNPMLVSCIDFRGIFPTLFFIHLYIV